MFLTIQEALVGRMPAALALTVLTGLSVLRADTTLARKFTIEKLADGIYAVIRREPPGLATHANNVFIVNTGDVMVVDTSQSVALTREVLAELRKITPKPVRYVINTHWHDDHYIGDQVYREAFSEVDIIGQARTIRDLPGEGVPNRAQMVKGLPPLIEKLRTALDTGQNLAGASITDEERAAYTSDMEWAGRYV